MSDSDSWREHSHYALFTWRTREHSRQASSSSRSGLALTSTVTFKALLLLILREPYTSTTHPLAM